MGTAPSAPHPYAPNPYSRRRSPRGGRALWLSLLGTALALALTSCGTDDPVADDRAAPAPTGSTSSSADSTPALSGDVVVFAAASLTEAFTQLGDDFVTANPGVTITISPGGSSALAQQIVAGSPADLFASASPATMATVTDAGLGVGEPVVFVRNRLEIAVPAGNPGGVTSLGDFAREDLTIALCAEEVPCGAAAAMAFAAADITPAPDTLEQDVKATLTKVELGEVDAALVYRTDVLVAGDTVEGIDFPEAEEAINDYPIVLLADAPNPEPAQAFLDFVLSDVGLEVLSDAGFDTD